MNYSCLFVLPGPTWVAVYTLLLQGPDRISMNNSSVSLTGVMGLCMLFW